MVKSVKLQILDLAREPRTEANTHTLWMLAIQIIKDNELMHQALTDIRRVAWHRSSEYNLANDCLDKVCY